MLWLVVAMSWWLTAYACWRTGVRHGTRTGFRTGVQYGMEYGIEQGAMIGRQAALIEAANDFYVGQKLEEQRLLGMGLGTESDKKKPAMG